MTKFYTNLGSRIKKVRLELGYSQDQLAKELDLDRVTISKIENGERKLKAEEVVHLSRFFNVDSDVLLDLAKDYLVVVEESKKVAEEPEYRISVPQQNIEKFKETLLYILEKVGSKPNVGQTVLYKLLYFIDFNYYEMFEQQLIGARYIKNHYGPTPVEFKKVIADMESQKDLVVVNDKYFKYPCTKYLPRRKSKLDQFTANEVKVIDAVLDKLSDMNATEISNYSHGDVPWITTEEGKEIEYEAVFYRTQEYSVRDYGDASI